MGKFELRVEWYWNGSQPGYDNPADNEVMHLDSAEEAMSWAKHYKDTVDHGFFVTTEINEISFSEVS